MKQNLQLIKKADNTVQLINKCVESGKNFNKSFDKTWNYAEYVIKSPNKTLTDWLLLASLGGVTALRSLQFASETNKLLKVTGLNK
jgi:hypothetical protein